MPDPTIGPMISLPASDEDGQPALSVAVRGSTVIRIAYTLSVEGQKSSLLSGGNGKRLQIREIPATAELIAHSVIRKDGSSWIYLSHHFSNPELEELGLPLPDSPNGRHLVCERRFGSVDEDTLKITMEERLHDHESYDFDGLLEDPAGYVLSIPSLNKAEECRARKRAASMRKRRDGRVREERKEEDRERKEIAKREAAAREGEQLRLRERDDWIREHGSGLLKKLLLAGMLDSDRTLYDRERIVSEIGEGWILRSDNQNIPPREDPAEHELDALLDERRRRPGDPSICLRQTLVDDGGWRYKPIVAMQVPWNPLLTAIKFVPPPALKSPPSPIPGQLPQNGVPRLSRQGGVGRKKAVRGKGCLRRQARQAAMELEQAHSSRRPRKPKPGKSKGSDSVGKWTKAIKKI
jgi:hypothetical protein